MIFLPWHLAKLLQYSESQEDTRQEVLGSDLDQYSKVLCPKRVVSSAIGFYLPVLGGKEGNDSSFYHFRNLLEHPSEASIQKGGFLCVATGMF